jgi:serine protease Do
LAGKKGPVPEITSPEKYPFLNDRYKAALVDEQGKLAQSCIHCHMIGDAQRQLYTSRKETIPDQVLLPYPHPKSLGLILDPKEKATVLSVDKKSLAEEAGFKEGDAILKMADQPLLSMADVQWVLHQTPAEGASVKAEVQRGDRTVELTLTLPKGWRQRDDISWRASTWGLRRRSTGGMPLEVLPNEERKKAGLSDKGMALRVKNAPKVGGPHGAAERAGFRQGDAIVSFDEKTDLLRETDLLVYALKLHKTGDQVAVTVMRDGKKIELKLPIQD